MGILIEGGLFIERKAELGARVHNPRKVAADLVQPSTEELFQGALALDESKPKEAMRRYRKILEIDPRHINTCINLGTLLCNKYRDYDGAKTQYLKAISIDPICALAHFDLANVLVDLGDVPAAINEYKITLQIAPLYIEAHFNLALAYEKTVENRRKALRHCQQYVRLYPCGPSRIHATDQLHN